MISTPCNAPLAGSPKAQMQGDQSTKPSLAHQVPYRVGRRAASLRSIAAAGVFAAAGFAGTAFATGSNPASPRLGVNLEGVNDWARMPVFADLMKASRAWGLPQSPWVHSVGVDADGWPTQDAGVVVRVLPGEPALPRAVRYMKAGAYALSFRGKANVNPVATSGVAVQDLRYDPGTNFSTAKVVVGATATQLMLAFTQTRGGVRDVRLYPPGHQPGETFTSAFLRAIEPFSVLRLMDPLSTNNNPVSSWDDRTRRESASQAGEKGMAWEHAVEIANQTGKDIWINVPGHASDAYVESLAHLLKSTLDPARVAYVEYSNELWNPMFAQARANERAAVEEALAGDLTLTAGETCSRAAFEARTGRCDPTWAGHFRTGKRTVRISEIFAGVFGHEAMNKRFRIVLASQYANRAVAEQMLKNIARYRGKPSSFLYGTVGAPYFSTEQGLMDAPGLLPTHVLDSLKRSLERDTLPFMAAGVGWHPFMKGAAYTGGDRTGATQKALADYYGLRSLAYEGGPDLLQGMRNMAAKSAANADERLGTFVERLLMQWYGCGNELFMYYNLASANGQYGFWGLTDDPENLDTPKFKAIRRVAQSRPAPTDCR